MVKCQPSLPEVSSSADTPYHSAKQTMPEIYTPSPLPLEQKHIFVINKYVTSQEIPDLCFVSVKFAGMKSWCAYPPFFIKRKKSLEVCKPSNYNRFDDKIVPNVLCQRSVQCYHIIHYSAAQSSPLTPFWTDMSNSRNMHTDFKTRFWKQKISAGVVKVSMVTAPVVTIYPRVLLFFVSTPSFPINHPWQRSKYINSHVSNSCHSNYLFPLAQH